MVTVLSYSDFKFQKVSLFYPTGFKITKWYKCHLRQEVNAFLTGIAGTGWDLESPRSKPRPLLGPSPSLHSLLQFPRAWDHSPSNSQEELRHTEVPWLPLNKLSGSSRAGRQTALPACQPGPKWRPQPHTIYKNPLKMVEVLNTRAKTVRLLEEKHSCKSLLSWIWFLRYDTKKWLEGKNG